MKAVPFALFGLALMVAMAWPLTAALGGVSGLVAGRSELMAAGCVPDRSAAAAPADGDDDEDDDAAALPPGHPSLALPLPPGHPPITADGLPPGHPPIGTGLPPGHPPIPSGGAPGSPSPAELFGAPVLLSI
jgi:hypothetical protein